MKTLSNDLLYATFPYWLSMKLLYEDGQNDEHVVIKAAGQLSRITQFIKCHSRVNVIERICYLYSLNFHEGFLHSTFLVCDSYKTCFRSCMMS